MMADDAVLARRPMRNKLPLIIVLAAVLAVHSQAGNDAPKLRLELAVVADGPEPALHLSLTNASGKDLPSAILNTQNRLVIVSPNGNHVLGQTRPRKGVDSLDNGIARGSTHEWDIAIREAISDITRNEQVPGIYRCYWYCHGNRSFPIAIYVSKEGAEAKEITGICTPRGALSTFYRGSDGDHAQMMSVLSFDEKDSSEVAAKEVLFRHAFGAMELREACIRAFGKKVVDDWGPDDSKQTLREIPKTRLAFSEYFDEAHVEFEQWSMRLVYNGAGRWMVPVSNFMRDGKANPELVRRTEVIERFIEPVNRKKYHGFGDFLREFHPQLEGRPVEEILDQKPTVGRNR